MGWQEEDVEEIIYDMRLSCQVNAFNGLGVLWMNERRWDVIKRRWWLHCMMLLKFIPLAAPPLLDGCLLVLFSGKRAAFMDAVEGGVEDDWRLSTNKNRI